MRLTLGGVELTQEVIDDAWAKAERDAAKEILQWVNRLIAEHIQFMNGGGI